MTCGDETPCAMCGGRWATVEDWHGWTDGEFFRDDLCSPCWEAWRDGRIGVRFGGVRYFLGGWRWAGVPANWRTPDFRAYRAGLRERLEERGKR